jgi:hypothetical protein
MIFEHGQFSRTLLQKSVIETSLNESRTFSAKSAYSTKPTVFLSHKHSEVEESVEMKDLRGVMGLLDELGAKVYIDSMDNKMPEQTTGETALRIKEVIKYCKKFILLATEKAIESYWCNWELGIGDTFKYIEHIAIIPVKESTTYDSRYKGNEYLQIYPSIDYEDGTNRYSRTQTIIPRGYYVCKPRDKEGTRYITSLSQWLKQ